jgi:small subunit ribosomal protein S10
MKIKLYIKSYYIPYLNSFIQKISKYLNRDLNIIKVQIFLPLKIERYTILRSPHADKKARDQFERKTHKRLIILNVPGVTKKNIFFLNRFFQMLQVFAVGVEFRITYDNIL